MDGGTACPMRADAALGSVPLQLTGKQHGSRHGSHSAADPTRTYLVGTFTGKGLREQDTKKTSQRRRETATTPSSAAPGPAFGSSRVRMRSPAAAWGGWS